MKKKIKYTDDKGELDGLDLKNYKVLPHDFFPSIDELIFKEESKKVTLDLERKSLEYLKKETKKRGGSYQRLIRNLVSSYVRRLQAA